jgi:transmembrane sensor
MISPTAEQRLNPQARAEAIEWLISFGEDEVGASERRQFNAWLRQSPEHVRAYLRVSAFWQEAHRIAPATKRDLDALAQAAINAPDVVVPLGVAGAQARIAQRVTTRADRGRRFAIAGVLGVALIGALAALLAYPGRTLSYSTGIGEQRTVTLQDGSTVVLNAQSRVDVRYSDERRALDLVAGQALFRVAKNPARPFVVRSGLASVTAVGTEFDVYRKSDGMVVTVLEGRVAVSNGATSALPATASADELLSAGEQMLVTPRKIEKHAAKDLAAVTSWTDGLLVFDAAPLSQVVQEFNRYNFKPLILKDAQLRDLQISGVFPATGAERITAFLRERFDVQAEETAHEIQLSRH